VLTLGSTGRVWVCVEPVDARKSYDGLAGVVTSALGRDPASGDGFAIYMRRLERGTFAFPTADTPEVSVTATQLAMILGGVELAGTRTRRRFARPESHANPADSCNPSPA
jgi:transposase